MPGSAAASDVCDIIDVTFTFLSQKLTGHCRSFVVAAAPRHLAANNADQYNVAYMYSTQEKNSVFKGKTTDVDS